MRQASYERYGYVRIEPSLEPGIVRARKDRFHQKQIDRGIEILMAQDLRGDLGKEGLRGIEFPGRVKDHSAAI